MTLNYIDDVGAALTDGLNAGTFAAGSFTAEEIFIPKIERARMGDDWHCWVVPADLNSTRVGRRRTRSESRFDIGLIKRLPDKAVATVKTCLRLCHQVHDYVEKDLAQLVKHDLTSAEFDPLYSEEHLRQISVFMSILTVSYRRRPA
ncbi:MAG: hypothetical protein Fues2KO_47140 [Fuerstiella sp.]